MRALCYWVKGVEQYPYLPVKATPSNGNGFFRRVHIGGRIVKNEGEERLTASYVKLGYGFEEAEDQIYEVDLVEKESGAQYLNAPKDDGMIPDHAIVLVNIAPGFDGESQWFSLENREIPCVNRGRRYPYKGTCNRCGEVVYGVHPADSGMMIEHEPFPHGGVRVIRTGLRTWGDQNRNGTVEYEARLVLMAPNTGLMVHRTGRIGDRIPEDIAIHWDGEKLWVGDVQLLNLPRNGEVEAERKLAVVN